MRDLYSSYLEWLRDVPVDSSFHFLDESGVNTSLTRDHARSPRGARANDSAPFRRGENLSMIGSISMKEFEAIMTIDGSVDGDVFEVFVRHFLGPKIKPGDFVVLDNCRVHYNQKSLDYLKKLGAVIVFLPPYSPELNPIELAWSKIKSTLKRIKARTREALDRAIAAALEEISESDLTNWFNHTMSFAHEF